jgi:hypothetical protein
MFASLPSADFVRFPRNISIHLGYALSVAGAALETSEHALAFTDQSLSYKRISVQNDFVGYHNLISAREILFNKCMMFSSLWIDGSCLETEVLALGSNSFNL